jgi:hypothetical protein
MSEEDERVLYERLGKWLAREEEEPVRKTLQALTGKIVEIEQAHKDLAEDMVRISKATDFRLQTLEANANLLVKEGTDAMKLRAKRIDDLAWRIGGIVILMLLGGGVVEVIHRLAAHP